MKKKLTILGIILVAIALPFTQIITEMLTAQTGPISEVREGDIIFQTSPSSQSPLIQLGTRSKISHCGVIVIRNNKTYVLETSKTLVITPLDKFIARGVAGRYWIKRSKKENVKISYRNYLGKPYDRSFKLDNNIYYCSELVYDIYKKQLDIELCEPRKVSNYLILGTNYIPKIKREMKTRGITMKQKVIAPRDIFNSDELEFVK